jgi:hypothetical protein
MNVLPETDKQVGAILEAIREVSPEVAEQAVIHCRIVGSVWLAVLLSVVGVLVAAFCWYAKRWDESDGHQVGAVITAIFACLFFAVCVNISTDLASAYYAPDYYAAECMIELARSALGN